LAGSSKKPAEHLTKTCQKPDKSLAARIKQRNEQSAIVSEPGDPKQNGLLMFISFIY
jgi:hypothetical protein